MAEYGRVGVSAVRSVGNIQETHQYDVDVRFNIGFDWVVIIIILHYIE